MPVTFLYLRSSSGPGRSTFQCDRRGPVAITKSGDIYIIFCVHYFLALSKTVHPVSSKLVVFGFYNLGVKKARNFATLTISRSASALVEDTEPPLYDIVAEIRGSSHHVTCGFTPAFTVTDIMQISPNMVTSWTFGRACSLWVKHTTTSSTDKCAFCRGVLYSIRKLTKPVNMQSCRQWPYGALL